MEKLMNYLKNKGAEITYNNTDLTQTQLQILPKPLKNLYKKIKTVEIQYAPFLSVEIYSIEVMMEETERLKDDTNGWFVFGRGMDGEHLLCATKQEEDGSWFTLWHHDNPKIDEACFVDILSLLEEHEEEMAEIIEEAVNDDTE